AADREPVASDAFHYQWIATDRFCRELRAAATEGAHVHGIAASAADAHRLNDRRMIAPALLAYGHYPEGALGLGGALGVLWALGRRANGTPKHAPSTASAWPWSTWDSRRMRSRTCGAGSSCMRTKSPACAPSTTSGSCCCLSATASARSAHCRKSSAAAAPRRAPATRSSS